MQVLITREQAACIADMCNQTDAAEALVTGTGGDLQVALLNDDGDNITTFTLRPGGEIEDMA
jgi:hypothetical protein